MSNQFKNNRIIISGGGTGGHVYPAISIAQAIRKLNSQSEILFVGANGKIEMQKVPQAGFPIKGLDIAGFKRSLSLSNFKVLFLLIKSLFASRKIVKDFHPDVVVGVGGYASGPLGFWANRFHIPLVLQEQNSYAGITNKLLAKKAIVVCTAYDNMQKFFGSTKILNTGNPIRDMNISDISKEKAFEHFGLDKNKKVVVFVGGSLGARAINNAVENYLIQNNDFSDFQIIWQTGKNYYKQISESKAEYLLNKNIKVLSFIDRMDYLFSVATVIISRAGAGTISELCMVAKPTILIPSPNVAEDHQTQNALALVKKKAAIMLRDEELEKNLFKEIIELIKNTEKQVELSKEMAKLAKPNASTEIAKLVLSV